MAGPRVQTQQDLARVARGLTKRASWEVEERGKRDLTQTVFLTDIRPTPAPPPPVPLAVFWSLARDVRCKSIAV